MFQDIIGAANYPAVITGQSMAEAAMARYHQVAPNYGGALTQGGPAQAALAQQLAARHAAMVVPRHATKSREYPLGFPTTTVKAGASQTIQAQPQVPFRGRRLIIPSDIAGSVLLTDIKVGKNSMFPTSNPVPGRAFTELGVGVDLNLDTAQISQIVALSVTNTSLADITFNAALIGTAVE